MQPKIQQVNGMTIDYSKSSMEVFATKGLADSGKLYFKFSPNLVRTLAMQNHAELVFDFDLCLLDGANNNETIVQLFAIFVITKNDEPLNQLLYVEQAVEFGRSLVADEVREKALKDQAGNDIVIPKVQIPAGSFHFVVGK